MAREHTGTIDRILVVVAVMSGGIAIGLGYLAEPLSATVLLGMTCATATGLTAIRRTLRHVDWFDCGYRAGWSDAAHEFCPFPAEPTSRRQVVPMRRRS